MDPYIPVPPEHYGGIERVVYDIACKYVEMGHRVTLIAGPNSESPDRLITYGANGALDPSVNFKLLLKVYTLIKREIKQHDVVHNFGRLMFLLPFLKSRTPKVQTYMRRVNRRNIEWFDTIKPVNLTFTAVSDAILGTGKTAGSKWQTVYNCAPIHKYSFNNEISDDGYLAFLGRIERCKGLHTAIEVAKLTGKQLIIAGNISALPIENQYYYNEIKPLIDGELIRYVGVVNDEQKNTLLRNAVALLTPVEWFEPFPIIIPEAYACGTPVLGFRNGGIPEGIEHGITGFISTNATEMAEHVNMIKSLSRTACRQKAVYEYSDAVIAQQYLKLYQVNAVS